jgi:GNAT superfamily N-acetyltransferase
MIQSGGGWKPVTRMTLFDAHGHVAYIVVAASAEGQGIGERLIQTAESWAGMSLHICGRGPISERNGSREDGS